MSTIAAVRCESPAPKRILVVDASATRLDALRRSAGVHWEVLLASDAESARAQLEQQPCDLVVAELDLPGESGAELLKAVARQWPDTLRILLCSPSDRPNLARLAPAAHQCLARTAPVGQIENALRRCLHLHDLLRDRALRAVVGRVRNLPALPRTYTRLRDLLGKDEVPAKAVARVIAEDPAIAAKVLQMANSAFFGLTRPIKDIDQAVTYLGFTTIQSLVLSVEVFAQWPRGTGPGRLDPDKLFAHVHAAATTARRISAGMPIADDVLLAALLHDIGYWVMVQEFPLELAGALDLAVSQSIPLHEAEKAVLGASHAEIGAYLLGIWGLPYSIIEAVAHHHAPQRIEQKEFDVLAALVVAHSLAPVEDSSAFDAPLLPDAGVDADYLARLDAPFDWTEATRRAYEDDERD